jgi:hypothetical protein
VAVGVTELGLIVLALTLAGIDHHFGAGGAEAPLVFGLCAVGVVVAYNRPDHVIGWILLGAAGFLLLDAVGASYSVLDYRIHRGHLPLGPVAVLIEPSWAPAIVLLVLGILLYPDGLLPSPRWRWPLRWVLAVAAVWWAGAFAIAIDAIVSGRIRVRPSGDLAQVDHPSGVWAWWEIAQFVFFATVLALFVSWIVSQTRSYRRLTGEARAQQKWLVGGAVIGVTALLVAIAASFSSRPLWATVANLAPAGGAALPVAIGIGILKWRLYDIDRLISRTLSYAVLTALLVGTFVGLVALTTDLLPFSSTVGVAASTLAAAALFNPLRIRVQRLVDRRFNRARYDADAAVAAFAARLRDAVDLETVRSELLAAVNRAVEPAHATIWLRPHASSAKVWAE